MVAPCWDTNQHGQAPRGASHGWVAAKSLGDLLHLVISDVPAGGTGAVGGRGASTAP